MNTLKSEIEIVAEKAFMISPDSVKKLEADLDKLTKLINKIKTNANKK